VWLLGSAVSAGAGPQSAASVPSPDESAIRTLISVYAKSVEGADTSLASTIWASTPDVSFIHPRGHEHGWEAVRTNFYEKTMRDLFSERELRVHNVVVHLYTDAAWAEFNWDFLAKLRKDGTQVKTQGRESQVYRKSSGRWSLVHVHYSGMPVTGERQGF
jgi:ketosteroid isomerase-like protein